MVILSRSAVSAASVLGMLFAVPIAASAATSAHASPSPSPTPLRVISTQVTVGTKTEHALVTLPVQADRIDRSEIDTTPGRTIEGALTAIPGYSQASTNSWFLGQHSNYADMRGLGAGSVLALFDGVPINDPLGSWVSWSRVPKLVVDSVEVAHGGASSLYGSEALGGVMQIETVTPRTDSAGFDLFTGNMHTGGGALVVTKALQDNAGVLFYIDNEHSNGYIRGANATAYDPNEPFARYDGQRIFTEYSQGKLSTGEIDAGFLDTEDHREGDYSGPTYYYGREGFTRYRRAYTNGNVQFTLYDNNDSYTFDRYSNVKGTYEQIGTGIMGLDSVGFLTSASRRAGDITFTVGADGKNIAGSRIEQRFYSPTMLNSGIQQFLGTYAQADLQLKRFEAIGGVREDFYGQRQALNQEIAPTLGVTPLPSNALHHMSPRLALRYSLTSRFNLRASYSNAFKAPDWGSLYSQYPGAGGALVVGNPNLKAMTVDEEEVGFDWTPDNKTRLYATLYDDRMNDRPVMTMTSPTTYSYENVSRADSGGYELSLQRDLTIHFSLRGSYANAPSRIDEQLNPAVNGNVIPESPVKTGTLALRYFDDQRALEFDVHRIGRTYYDEANRQPIDNTALFDASFSQNIAHVAQAYVEVQNIFNRQWYAEPTTWAPPRSIVVGLRRTAF